MFPGPACQNLEQGYFTLRERLSMPGHLDHLPVRCQKQEGYFIGARRQKKNGWRLKHSPRRADVIPHGGCETPGSERGSD